MSEHWTIDQLAPLVEMALDMSGYNGQQSQRVRTVPDLRTIRYYTTLGLLDPPAEMRGRKAFYGRRHLVQLVAIKRLQAKGLSLAEVQASLVALGDRGLEETAALPGDFWERVPRLPEPARSIAQAPAAERKSFWVAEPIAENGVAERPPEALLALHLPVAEGAELVIEGIDPTRLTPEAIARLKRPLAELARELRHLRNESNQEEK